LIVLLYPDSEIVIIKDWLVSKEIDSDENTMNEYKYYKLTCVWDWLLIPLFIILSFVIIKLKENCQEEYRV